MSKTELFGRFTWSGNGTVLPLRVEFVSPAGERHSRPAFWHQPTICTYDHHGYETIAATGVPIPQARFTPTAVGVWRYRAVYKNGHGAEGTFECLPSTHAGFVQVSTSDSRYFATSNGSSFLPIGLNLCWPVSYKRSAGTEFQTSNESATLGARDYDRWFRQLSENGGNFARLWLGTRYFQVETTVAGVHDPLRFAALDQVVALARKHGIRLKLCLEYFRNFTAGAGQSRTLTHPDTGQAPPDMDTWFKSDDWQGLWWHKVDALVARYGDDPTVMAWELWNEIDCCHVSGWEVVRDWTQNTLARLKAASPQNLVTNSLGSFDGDGKMRFQTDFGMDEMDFQQVHRYLDQGGGLAICRGDTVTLAADAVQRTRRVDRPILLAETGAVNDNHSGPFIYYRHDNSGIIFHDTTYAPFFAGAAASGHCWHWDVYVEQKNLLPGLKALADAVRGVALDKEAFQVLDWSTPEYWCLVLRGRTQVLGWVRNKQDNWQRVLLEDTEPGWVTPNPIPLKEFGFHSAQVALFRPWPQDAAGEAHWNADGLHLPALRHGLIFRAQAA